MLKRLYATDLFTIERVNKYYPSYGLLSICIINSTFIKFRTYFVISFKLLSSVYGSSNNKILKIQLRQVNFVSGPSPAYASVNMLYQVMCIVCTYILYWLISYERLQYLRTLYLDKLPCAVQSNLRICLLTSILTTANMYFGHTWDFPQNFNIYSNNSVM